MRKVEIKAVAGTVEVGESPRWLVQEYVKEEGWLRG